MTEKREKELQRQMEEASCREGRITPKVIARMALDAGMNIREALHEVQRLQDRRGTRRGDLADVLTQFISTLCRQSKARQILEYSNTASLLTSWLAESHEQHQLTYVVPNQEIAETLQVLFDNSSSVVRQSIADIPKATCFDAIVCQPPIGHKHSGVDMADGFGGEVVRELAPFLAEGGSIYWITGRGVLRTPRAMATFSELERASLHRFATIDVATGAWHGTMIEGTVIVFRHEVPKKQFLGALRDLDSAELMAVSLLKGPSKKPGPSWIWQDSEDQRTFADLEQERLLQKLAPRGRRTPTSLGSLLTSKSVERADKPVLDDQAETFLYVPEYPDAPVTFDIADQTVKAKTLYRLAVDPSKCNPRFLAQLLNSPYGKQLRLSVSRGATIQRISVTSLLSLELALPDTVTQDKIARFYSDIGILAAEFQDMQTAIEQDWTIVTDVTEKIDGLKAVLDIERRIADWWRELPYPLATIYRRYQVETEPKERLETLLYFFEITSVYLAAIGTSYVKALRPDWQEVLPKWLHPKNAAGIERTDFGFWKGLAVASMKDTSRIVSDKELRAIAIDRAGAEVVGTVRRIGSLRMAAEVLTVPIECRNTQKAHGGRIKPRDAEKLEEKLQQSIRDLYEQAAPVFRSLHLVRTGKADVTDTGYKFDIEKLCGSDPTFNRERVELDRPVKSHSLAFWRKGERVMCQALPFLRLGVPQQPQETSFYVFNRVQDGGFRWICYQEASEQEFVAPDEELRGLINLGKREE